MEKRTLAIHGSCVSRDIFEFAGEKAASVKVGEYVARNSIFSAVADPVVIPSKEFYEDGNWQKRMVQIDCGKTLFSRLRDARDDYLLIDLIDERFALNKTDRSCFTWSGGAAEYLPDFPRNTVHAMNLPASQTKAAAERYCEAILSIFPPERIILYRAMLVEKYLDEHQKLQKFPREKLQYYRKLNRHFERMYDLLEERLGCHVMNLPPDTVATTEHKWGLAPMHYHRECYDLALKAILGIMGGGVT